MQLSPAITFQVALTPFSTEAVGPKSNEYNPTILQPDQYQPSPDQGRTEFANRKNTRSTYLPSITGGDNYIKKDTNQFTLYGQEAIYMRKMYGIGYAPADRAYLTIVSVS